MKIFFRFQTQVSTHAKLTTNGAKLSVLSSWSVLTEPMANHPSSPLIPRACQASKMVTLLTLSVLSSLLVTPT